MIYYTIIIIYYNNITSTAYISNSKILSLLIPLFFTADSEKLVNKWSLFRHDHCNTFLSPKSTVRKPRLVQNPIW